MQISFNDAIEIERVELPIADSGDAPLDLDWIALAESRSIAELATLPRLVIDESTHPLARTVDLLHATGDALLVPSGASVTWRVEVPRERPRLLFRPAALSSDCGRIVDLAILVDGQPTWRGSVTSPEPGYGAAPGIVEVAFSADADDRVIDPVQTLLWSKRLRDLGWSTAAFTSGGPVQPRSGFGLGFDWYGIDDPRARSRLNRLPDAQKAARARGEHDDVDFTLDWLRRHADQPFCLFVHAFLVRNYRPHPHWRARGGAGAAKPSDRSVEALSQQADRGEAAAVAERLGRAERTVVCVIADHGEEFQEHGRFGLHQELDRESTQVPWILRGPDVPRRRSRDCSAFRPIRACWPSIVSRRLRPRRAIARGCWSSAMERGRSTATHWWSARGN